MEILAVAFMVLFTLSIGLLVKMMFDINQQLMAVRQNTYLMCSVLPLHSGSCVQG